MALNKGWLTNKYEGAFSHGNVLTTQIAWAAGTEAYGYASKLLSPYLTDETQQDEKLLEFFQSGVEPVGDWITIETDDNGKYAYPRSDVNKYYLKSSDRFAGTGYFSAFLRIEGQNELLVIPCVNGCPEITLNTRSNMLPLASNTTPLTTNIVVEPNTFRFVFPVAYWKVLGQNDLESEVRETQGILNKIGQGINSAKQAYNEFIDKATINDEFGNPIGFLKVDADDEYGKVKERSIPTIEQVYAEISKFNTNKVCYLYLGFRNRVAVTCKIKLNFTKEQMDCVWVEMMLTETMSVGKLGVGASVIKVVNVGSTNSTGSNVNGEKITSSKTINPQGQGDSK